MRLQIVLQREVHLTNAESLRLDEDATVEMRPTLTSGLRIDEGRMCGRHPKVRSGEGPKLSYS